MLEAFGVGNFPDLPQQGWVPWLRQQTRKGLQVNHLAGPGLHGHGFSVCGRSVAAALGFMCTAAAINTVKQSLMSVCAAVWCDCVSSQVYLASQCHLGPLKPELYKSGALALEMGVEAGPQMTPECAVVKMMLCLAHPDIPLGQPLAGEL